MAWSKLTDMELSDDEKIDREMPGATPSKPDFPWGLRISLTEKELEKLGLDADCDIGDMIDLRAFAVVTSVSKNKSTEGADSCRVELQIEKMAVESEDEE